MTTVYCPFCGNRSTVYAVDQEWINDATSAINELKTRAEAAEARAAESDRALDLANAHAKRLMDERDDWKRQAAQMHQDVMNGGASYVAKCETITDLQRINSDLIAERDDLRRQLTQAQAALLKIHEQSYRASLVQDRSVGIIKQVCASISVDAKDAAVQAARS